MSESSFSKSALASSKSTPCFCLLALLLFGSYSICTYYLWYSFYIVSIIIIISYDIIVRIFLDANIQYNTLKAAIERGIVGILLSLIVVIHVLIIAFILFYCSPFYSLFVCFCLVVHYPKFQRFPLFATYKLSLILSVTICTISIK